MTDDDIIGWDGMDLLLEADSWKHSEELIFFLRDRDNNIDCKHHIAHVAYTSSEAKIGYHK